MNNYTTSDSGVDLVKGFEKFSPVTYNLFGIDHIAYGHVKNGEQFIEPLTKEQGDEILRSDLTDAEKVVNARISVPLKQNQFDALVSLAFNIPYAFYDGSIDNLINSGAQDEVITQKWLSYNKAKVNDIYVEVDGLTERRKKELDFFLQKIV